jgi:hypothetical protein
MRCAAGWSLAALYAWVAAGIPSFSWEATAAVLLAGAAVSWLGALVPASRRPAPPPLTRRAIVLWSVPVFAFGVLEITDDVLGSTPAHPTLSILLDPVLAERPVRAVAFLAWLAAGWWLARR